MDLINYFPKTRTPRPAQVSALNFLSENWDKYKYFLIEAPVGSGKSLLAMTIASAVNNSHILTPRRGLQDQYRDEFPDIAVMKGRSNYPCTYTAAPEVERRVFELITKSENALHLTSRNCGDSPPCANENTRIKCQSARECPFARVVALAQQHKTVVHNVFSFMYHAKLGNKFEQRQSLIVDECHSLESAVRNMMTSSYRIKKLPIPDRMTLDEAKGFIMKEYEAQRRSYSEMVDLRDALEKLTGDLVIEATNTEVRFIPYSVAGYIKSFILDFGQKIIFMSGTIYGKKDYCRSVGIPPEETAYISLPSDFPVGNRPVILRRSLATDNSFASWEENKPRVKENILKVLRIFPDVKGLIHTTSYSMMESLGDLDKRILTHDKNNLAEAIDIFTRSTEPLVLISPAISEGFDFKDDLARFQIILRIPYPSIGSPFVARKAKEYYPWIQQQALITFGQQIGRIVRSNTDWGKTVLLDSRFERFIKTNKTVIPKWLMDSIVFKD